MNTPTKPPVTFTRQELYEFVWATPIDRLAKEYGMSGRGLQKVCERLDVPTPPRGYWAKLAAGKNVIKFRLPPPKADTPLEATISPYVAPPAPEPASPEVLAVIETQRAQARTVAVPKTLTNPHPIIQSWIDTSRKRTASAKRFGDLWVAPQIDASSIEKRRLRILSALFKELERRGHKIKPEREVLNVAYPEVNGTRVEFSLKERIKKARVPLMADEMKESWNRDRKWKQVETATGELAFKITSKVYKAGLVTAWQDMPDKPIEDQLSDIVVGIVGVAAKLAEQEAQRLENERLRLVRERHRYEEERRKKIEANRFKHVLDLSDRWIAAENGRRFLDRLEEQAIAQSSDGALTTGTMEWFTWARKMFDNHDPLRYVVDSLIGFNEKISEWNYGR